MTLDERIAKRKAEGWGVAYWIVKNASNGTVYSECEEMENADACLPLRWVDSAESLLDAGVVAEAEGAKVTPVFHRTIKRHRTYSFWQACKMAMAGKKMRRIDSPLTVENHSGSLRWSDGSGLLVTETNINARWELAE